MRVAYLGPAGTYSDEALRASAAGRRDGRSLRRVHETVMAVQRGRGRARDRADRELARGRRGRHPRRARRRGRRRAHRRRGRAADPPLPDRRAAARARADRARGLPSRRRLAQCARFLRERLPAARARRRGLHGRGGALAARRRRARGPRSARASPPSSTAARCWPRASRTSPGNVTRFVWLAPAGAASRAGRPGQDLDRLLGRRRRVAGLARGRARRAGRPRRQPHADRVAAEAGAARALHVLRRPRRRRGARAGGGSARRRCASGSRSLRVLGSYPAAEG